MCPPVPSDTTPVQEVTGPGGSLAKADAYAALSKSKNSERAYKSAIAHYREWGGILPAGKDQVRKYLSDYAGKLKVSTLRQRLNQISKWHKLHSLPDPTTDEAVKATMAGIAKKHMTVAKQAYPLRFRHLLDICDRLEAAKRRAISEQNQGEILRTHRDLALILIGFWNGFRSDELNRLEVQHVTANRSAGISIFIPYSKTDQEANGSTHSMEMLNAYCPANAYLDWIQVAGITAGPVFRPISRWGSLGDDQINKHSIERVLNRVSAELFPGEPKFSTHSLRRGFADWAVNEGWDLKTLMEHVGWKSVQSAQRYIPTRKTFGSLSSRTGASAITHELELPGVGSTILAEYTIEPSSGD